MSTITYEDLVKMAQVLDDLRAVKEPSQLSIMGFAGMPIIESPHVQDLVPVIQLSEYVTVSTKFRRECNAYYVKRFGYKTPQLFRTPYGLLAGKNTCALLAGVVA